MCLVSCWAKMLGQVDTFILEFEKVFDTPPHIRTGRAEIFFLSQDNRNLEWTYGMVPMVGCGFCLWLFLDFSNYLFTTETLSEDTVDGFKSKI